MDLKGVIQKTFNDTIRRMDINSELRASLKDHPRTKQLLQNLHTELLKVDVVRRSKGKRSLKEQTITETVKSFTVNFVQGISKMADERIMSDLEKIRIKAEEQKKKELELASQGKFVGEFEELNQTGLKIGETTVNGQKEI